MGEHPRGPKTLLQASRDTIAPVGLLDVLFRRVPKPGVVLALGGGGARGLAHLGVLEVIEEKQIPVVGIAGTSAGAVVGAMWLTLGSVQKARERWQEFLVSDFPSYLPDVRLTEDISSRDNILLSFAQRFQKGAQVVLALHRRGLVEQDELERAVAFLVPDVRIESLPVPYAAVVTEFATGKAIAVTRGKLRQAVAASSAVPGVVPPYPLEGRFVLDGGVVAEVPVEHARQLARRPVVAVDVGDVPHPDEDAKRITVPRALMRATLMTHLRLRQCLLSSADLVIAPEVGGIHWSEFRRLEEAVEAGRKAAISTVNRLQALATRKTP